jgi:serine O-acetyltransferase
MSKIVVVFYKIAYYLMTMRIPLLPHIFNILFVRILFGCYVGLGAKIGKNTVLGYGGIGIVIHGRSIIGNNVIIHSGVSLAGTSKKYGVPTIGDNCIISTGAKIIGPVSIGNNCIIGANAVVLTDIPDNCVAVGVPAKIIKRDINILDYRD